MEMINCKIISADTGLALFTGSTRVVVSVVPVKSHFVMSGPLKACYVVWVLLLVEGHTITFSCLYVCDVVSG